MWKMANKQIYMMMEKLCLFFSSGFINFFSTTQTVESAKQTEKYESSDSMVCIVLKKINEAFNKKIFSEKNTNFFPNAVVSYSVLTEILT